MKRHNILMMHNIWHLLTIVLLIATITTAVMRCPWWATAACAATALLLLLLYRRSVKRPLDTVQNGIYLIREQDFSTSLRPTGQRDADKVVELFNSLMAVMKAERLKLQEQNFLLDKLIAASPTGIAICDFDGNIVSANNAFRSLTNDRILTLLASLDMSGSTVVRSEANQILRCSSHWFMDTGFRRRFFMVETLTDEIVKAEKQVFNKIVRTMGHEVNNTLGSVVSVLDTLSTIDTGSRTVTDTIESCRDSCLNLVDFVRNYATLVKTPRPELTATDMVASLSRLTQSLKVSAPPNVTIEFKPVASDMTVMADMMLMERVIMNIVKNAIESIGARDNGLITIACDGNTITVTDNGAGLTADAAVNLFTPFFSTKNPDRGLGLMLVADILHAHNATYNLTTDETTHLTTFTIRFNRS